MAQGFKPAKAGTKAKDVRKKSSGPKRGTKVIAPKSKSAVELASQKKRQTASLTQKIEADMAGRASGGGPLTIMKKLGEKVNEEKEKEKERKLAKKKAKGRA